MPTEEEKDIAVSDDTENTESLEQPTGEPTDNSAADDQSGDAAPVSDDAGHATDQDDAGADELSLVDETRVAMAVQKGMSQGLAMMLAKRGHLDDEVLRNLQQLDSGAQGDEEEVEGPAEAPQQPQPKAEAPKPAPQPSAMKADLLAKLDDYDPEVKEVIGGIVDHFESQLAGVRAEYAPVAQEAQILRAQLEAQSTERMIAEFDGVVARQPASVRKALGEDTREIRAGSPESEQRQAVVERLNALLATGKTNSVAKAAELAIQMQFMDHYDDTIKNRLTKRAKQVHRANSSTNALAETDLDPEALKIHKVQEKLREFGHA